MTREPDPVDGFLCDREGRYFWHIELAEEGGNLRPTGNDFIDGGPLKAH